jgi:mRNA interferase RelE/StbE
MANYKIEISATAEKKIRKLSRENQIHVLRAIEGLAGEPHPPGSRKLRGYEDVYRIRTGTFRILYSVEKARVLIIILKVGHRKEIYR